MEFAYFQSYTLPALEVAGVFFDRQVENEKFYLGSTKNFVFSTGQSKNNSVTTRVQNVGRVMQLYVVISLNW